MGFVNNSGSAALEKHFVNWSGFGRKLLAFLLTLALVFGLMPGLAPMQAHADDLIPVANTGGSATVSLNTGMTFNLDEISGLFTIDQDAGARTYSEEDGGTASGSISGSTLTVFSAGTLSIGLETAETATHAAGAKVIGTLTVEKKDVPVPDTAPDLASKTATSVTIFYEATYDTEFSKDGAKWQPSGTFTGLAPNREYTFYVRFQEDSTHKPSPASPPLTVTTEKAQLGGDLNTIPNTHPKYGETRTADVSELTSTPSVPIEQLGELSYRWLRRDVGSDIATAVEIPGATGSSYTFTADDIAKCVSLTVTAANCTGFVMKDYIYAQKADGPAAPTVTGSYTGDGTRFIYTVNPIPGALYGITEEYGWQQSNIFYIDARDEEDGGYRSLRAMGNGEGDYTIRHTFYAYIPPTATHQQSATGNTGEVVFKKLDPAAPPLNHTVTDTAGGFPKTVTIAPKDGAEYSFDGGRTWSDVNVRTSTQPETLTLAIRLKETYTHNLSPMATKVVSTATPPTVQTADSIPGGAVGKAYSYTLKADGTQPTWSIASGSLPKGLKLNEATGVISGKPTSGGAYSFTVRATNAAGSASKKLKLNINGFAKQKNGKYKYYSKGKALNSGFKRLTVKGKKHYYYFAANGIMYTGWKYIKKGGKKYKYYFGAASDGKMHTGWKTIKGKRYYFGGTSDGRMRTGKVKIGGKYYTFGNNGVLRK